MATAASPVARGTDGDRAVVASIDPSATVTAQSNMFSLEVARLPATRSSRTRPM